MKSCLLSVVIPHKDIPDLLRRCLERVPRREDIQVIVADDCSLCDTGKLLEEWGFDNVELYRLPESRGGGAARNIGLSKVRGEWVTFIDADDYFTPAAEDVFNTLKDMPDDVDLVFCAACSVDCVNYTNSDRADWLNKHIAMYATDPKESEMRLRYTFGFQCCKIARMEMIRKYGIHFDETPIHNDTKYSYTVGHYARKVSVDERALCTITTRSGSVSKTLPEANKLHRIRIFGEEERFFVHHNIPLRYQIGFLWAQMARSRLENRQTYRRGCEILQGLGIKKTRIWLMTAKHMVRNSMVRMAKGILNRFPH